MSKETKTPENFGELMIWCRERSGDAATLIQDQAAEIARLREERPKIWEVASEMMADFYVGGKRRSLFEDWEAEKE